MPVFGAAPKPVLRAPAALMVAAGIMASPACTASRAPRSSAPARSLTPPPALSQTARALLSRRMESHGFEMTNLMWATLLLDRAGAADIAGAIVAEPRLARPITQDSSELNAGLPPSFFTLQDQFVEAAERLKVVAEDTSATPEAIAEVFSDLTQTCVRCHATYMFAQ